MTPTQQLDQSDFSALRQGQQITLHHESGHRFTGVLEDLAEDASVVWVQLDNGAGRRLFHREDGYAVSV